MAIYHLDVSVISRSAGRSSTAAAAYRLAARIADERTGLTHDYRRRTGVVASGAIGWEQGAHAALWNAAEAAEIRRNACTAREVMIALPAELDAEQQARLVRGFAAHLRDRYGVAATWAIHAAPKGGDDRNTHAHILMTTRRVDAAGRFGEKTRALDDRRQGPEEIRAIRAEWEKRVNRALEKTGSAARVSGRKRGLDPMEHLGPVATAQERRGIRTRAGNRNRRRIASRERARAVVREIRTLQQEQALEDLAAAQAATRAEQAKAEALEAAAQKIKAEAEAQRRRAEQAAQKEAAVGVRRDCWAVLRTIAERAQEIAAATYRSLLAEVRRLADWEDRARPRQGQRQR